MSVRVCMHSEIERGVLYARLDILTAVAMKIVVLKDVSLCSLVKCTCTTSSIFISFNVMYFLKGNSYHTKCMKQTRDMEVVCVVDIQMYFQKTIGLTRTLSIVRRFYLPSTCFTSEIIWSSFFRIYLNFSFYVFIGFMMMKVMCTYDLRSACYFPAHIAFFAFIKLMIEGRLQAKTSDVSSFISVTGHSNRTHT